MSNEVRALGYVVITAEDLDAWRKFGESILGLQLAETEGTRSTNALKFRADERAWRLGVENGPNGGLAALGLEVSNRGALEALKTRLEKVGVGVADDPDLAAERQVAELFRASDPSGNPLEFYYGALIEETCFVSPQATRFVTGTQGIGHAVLMVDHVDDVYSFYVDTLGFRVSDIASVGPTSLYFTSPNSRHHSIAFGSPPPGIPSMLQHINLQVEDIDMLGRALDRVYDNDVAMRAGLGRHINDLMVSFYCFSPSGMLVEYGWGAREIKDPHHVTGRYEVPHLWGHRPPDGSRPH